MQITNKRRKTKQLVFGSLLGAQCTLPLCNSTGISGLSAEGMWVSFKPSSNPRTVLHYNLRDLKTFLHVTTRLSTQPLPYSIFCRTQSWSHAFLHISHTGWRMGCVSNIGPSNADNGSLPLFGAQHTSHAADNQSDSEQVQNNNTNNAISTQLRLVSLKVVGLWIMTTDAHLSAESVCVCICRCVYVCVYVQVVSYNDVKRLKGSQSNCLATHTHKRIPSTWAHHLRVVKRLSAAGVRKLTVLSLFSYSFHFSYSYAHHSILLCYFHPADILHATCVDS